MNIIIYKNDGRNIGINNVQRIRYDLINKRVDFYFTEHKTYSMSFDEFWEMNVREEYEKENY